MHNEWTYCWCSNHIWMHRLPWKSSLLLIDCVTQSLNWQGCQPSTMLQHPSLWLVREFTQNSSVWPWYNHIPAFRTRHASSWTPLGKWRRVGKWCLEGSFAFWFVSEDVRAQMDFHSHYVLMPCPNFDPNLNPNTNQCPESYPNSKVILNPNPTKELSLFSRSAKNWSRDHIKSSFRL